MRLPQTPFISFLPFKQELLSYSWNSFRLDSIAAVSVALMTIPQSIAYALLAGLPPIAGVLSAIFGAIFTAAFGSSRNLVAGPSTGVAILIQTSISGILTDYFDLITGPARDALVLALLGQIVLIMGLIQIGCAFFNIAKLLQFVSRPVMLGYFAGIAIAIVVNQLFYFCGVPSGEGGVSLLFKAGQFVWNSWQLDWKTLLVGCVSLGLVIFLRRRWKALPDALIMLIAISVCCFCISWWFAEPITATLQQVELSLSHELIFPLIDFKLINKIFPAATAIAFLAILEVVSVSRNFAARSGQSVQINQDVFGLGLSNFFLSCFVSAMPASGSATRTLLNVRMLAQTRFAAILSGLFVAIIIAFCWPLLQHIPLAALAALLIATIPALVDLREIQMTLRVTAEDRWVFFLTFASCLIFSLEIAFFVGIVISIATYLRRSAIPHLVEYAFNSKGRLTIINSQDQAHRKVRIIGIGGDLYFATADVFQAALQAVVEDPYVQAIVLRLNNVYHMDASMCLAIYRLQEILASTHRSLVISGLTEEVWRVFHRAGLVKEIGLDNLYFTDETNPQFSTWKACLRAQELIHRKGSVS